jgi:hypothetical protein
MHREENSRASDTVGGKSSLARPTDAVGYQGGRCHELPGAATCPPSAAKEV